MISVTKPINRQGRHRFSELPHIYILLLMFVALLPPRCVAQPLMRDVFAAMPDSVLPMVTRNNRLDCIDFIENQMEARVRNRVDEYVTLEALTDDYARFRTSPVAVMEMKLLTAADSTTVLCIVTTAQSGEQDSTPGMEDSNIRFLRPDWSPLPTPVAFATPPVDAFIADDTDDSDASAQARRALTDIHPMSMHLAPETSTLTLNLQTALLSREEKETISTLLNAVVMQWDGYTFATIHPHGRDE